MQQDFSWINALLIDDSRAILQLVSSMLSDIGIQNISHTQSAKEAIKNIETQNNINLIMLDLNMPEMDGIEFLNQLVRVGYQGHLIIMSGAAPRVIMSVEELARMHKLNYAGSLLKPLSLQELKNVIERLGQVNKEPNKLEQLKIYEIIQAIRNQEIDVVYQPQIHLRDRCLYGVEALARIEHPKLGTISPAQFIDKMENSDLIVELTYQVIQKTLSDWQKWKKQGLYIKVSVNVSPFVLQQEDFADNVMLLLDLHDMPVTYLCIEITELTLASDMQQELTTLSRLNMKGIALALDDFGQDNASIERLQQLPINILKLDKSYFLKQQHRQGQITLIQSCMALAERLHLLVVAEGIERAEHWRLCGEMGCDVAQGYFISKPLPSKQLYLWLQKWEQQIT